MKLPKEKRNQVVADAVAINDLIARSFPRSRHRIRKGGTSRLHRAPQLPVPKDTTDLCKQLACMAALDDSAERQAIIFLAIRTLQRLDLAAVEAGILPATHKQP